MMDFRFERVEWVHAMWLLAALVGLLVWLEFRGSSALDRFLTPLMQRRLVRRIPAGRRWLSLGLWSAAAAMLVIALMRPQWGLRYEATPRFGAQIMVCLDVSKSMLAEDTAPNRLGRAKAELVDLLGFLDGDQVGLIAFAGDATVVCPMTSDFGFLRLALDGTSPNTVGRGGTQLSQAIHKAVDGFRGESDLSRVILMITDGEDHDSLPDDAAKVAAERGIKIIAIGFGDEAGSEIPITDPRTGVRETVKDQNGAVVRSRLDGETLRRLALMTEGAYVPAGTGALDLESIYERHVSTLVRGQMDGRGRAVRNEAYQWAILLAIVLLIASVAVRAGAAAPVAALDAALVPRAAVIGALVATLWSADVVRAQSADDGPPKSADISRADLPPRETYNDAVAVLASDVDRAEQLFQAAREHAGTDGEVRFRSAYNMGWLEAQRADDTIQDEPEQALTHLRGAADWFREAIRLNPQHRDARHNLEVMLRRIQQLADSLAKKNEGDLAAQLDALIAQQRAMIGETRGVIEQAEGAGHIDSDPALRSSYRAAAVHQRQVMSDSQRLSETAGEQLDSLNKTPPSERAEEDQLRAAQLGGVLVYLEKAGQRMGQTRSQLRLGQGGRAFRRANVALDELKRARDQLRDPVEILGLILADTAMLARETGAKSATEDVAAPAVPAWLTLEYLQDRQQNVLERTTELSARLDAGLSHEPSPAGPQPAGAPPPPEQNPEVARFLEQVREALPLVKKGEAALEDARLRLEDPPQLTNANQRQLDALLALSEAREKFLDLRGLVELAYGDQSRIAGLLVEDPERSVDEALEYLTAARQLEDKNVARGMRLGTMIERALSELPATDENADPAADPAEGDAQRQQLETARRLRTAAQTELETAAGRLAGAIDSTETNQRDTELAAGRVAADNAREHLYELRRLFFSVIEHLRETAQRQAQLNDETRQIPQDAADTDLAQQAGPLVPRQQELSEISRQIAEALDHQAQQAAQAPAAGGPPQNAAAQGQPTPQQMAEAAEMVTGAKAHMDTVVDQLGQAPARVQDAGGEQDQALELLVKALQLLEPPDDQQQNQQQQNDDQNDEQQQQQQTGADVARLLQAIRDQEANRRKEKSKARAIGSSAVGKDW